MTTPSDAFKRYTRRNDPGKPIREDGSGKGIRELGRLLELANAEVVRRLVLRSYQALTSATPVDLGTARSGWTPSVGSPVLDPISAPKDEGQAKQAAARRFSANQAKAAAVAASYLIRQGPAFIANAVPWIVPLNEGSSSQAASKFVERAIATAIRSVDQAA